MLLLKTRAEHMDGVRRQRMHATDAAPRHVGVGDWLLVQVTYGKQGNEAHRVRYAMRFAACTRDDEQLSFRIWGQTWKYLIRGTDFRLLKRPFDIEQVQVSGANYGRGAVRYAYVEPVDAAEIVRRGLLDGA